MLDDALTLLRRAGRLTAIGLIVLGAAAGWALAAANGSTGVIHACAAKRNGTLRLASACDERERPLAWNVQGPPGTARAFGLVSADGTLTRARNATVHRAALGIYCITPAAGIDPTTTGVIATPDFTNDSTAADRSSDDNSAHIEFHATHPDCPGSALQVDTFEISNANSGGDHYDVEHFDQPFFFAIP